MVWRNGECCYALFLMTAFEALACEQLQWQGRNDSIKLTALALKNVELKIVKDQKPGKVHTPRSWSKNVGSKWKAPSLLFRRGMRKLGPCCTT